MHTSIPLALTSAKNLVMPNTLLTTYQIESKELEQKRRELIVKILDEQRNLNMKIHTLREQMEFNKATLAKLADPQPQPEEPIPDMPTGE